MGVKPDKKLIQLADGAKKVLSPKKPGLTASQRASDMVNPSSGSFSSNVSRRSRVSQEISGEITPPARSQPSFNSARDLPSTSKSQPTETFASQAIKSEQSQSGSLVREGCFSFDSLKNLFKSDATKGFAKGFGSGVATLGVPLAFGDKVGRNFLDWKNKETIISSCNQMIRKLKPNFLTKFCCRGLRERLQVQIELLANFRTLAEKLRSKLLNESSTIVVVDVFTARFAQNKRLSLELEIFGYFAKDLQTLLDSNYSQKDLSKKLDNLFENPQYKPIFQILEFYHNNLLMGAELQLSNPSIAQNLYPEENIQEISSPLETSFDHFIYYLIKFLF